MSSKPVVAREMPAVLPDTCWDEAGILPCLLSVDLAVKGFTVRDLLELAPGAILESENASGADVPVVVNTRIIGWAEFEVVSDRLAVRLTELA